MTRLHGKPHRTRRCPEASGAPIRTAGQVRARIARARRLGHPLIAVPCADHFHTRRPDVARPKGRAG